MKEPGEDAVMFIGVALGALIAAGLMLGFYAAFRTDRIAFWTWLAGLAVLVPGDLLHRRFTNMLTMPPLVNFYSRFGVPYPRVRARIALTFARLLVPLFVLAFLDWQVWGAIRSTVRTQPAVAITAFICAAAAGSMITVFYSSRE